MDRPILFSAPMVLALLAGRKTQTRRLASSPLTKCQLGDRLWVRETFAYVSPDESFHPLSECNIEYRADTGAPYPGEWPPEEARGNDDAPKWRPGIHMPRWASRLTLAVSDVRRQRLQDISEEDARAEGHVNGTEHPDSVVWATDVWDVLHGEGSWRSNPEIVAITFAVERQNIDALAKAT